MLCVSFIMGTLGSWCVRNYLHSNYCVTHNVLGQGGTASHL